MGYGVGYVFLGTYVGHIGELVVFKFSFVDHEQGKVFDGC